jgi:transcriptional regulator with XRE-family HTH domain
MKKQGERLKLIRISKGMSQDNVAKALGITIGAYSKIERGGTRLNLDRLNQLAGIFNIDLNNLNG